MRAKHYSTAVLVLLLGASLSTCGESTGPDPHGVRSIVISGTLPTRVGQVGQLGAKTYDGYGQELTGHRITWASLYPSRADVDSTGLVSAIAAGSTTIVATSDGVADSVPLNVGPRLIYRVDVIPAIDSIFPGATLQLRADAKDQFGALVTGLPAAWVTSDTSRALVSASGLVTARTAGSVLITATVEGWKGGSFLTLQHPVASLVLPDSVTARRYHSLQLQPEIRSATGTTLSGRSVVWLSEDTAIVQTSPTGLLTPGILGSTRVSATSEGVSDTVVVTVAYDSATAVYVSADSDHVDLGGEIRLTAYAIDDTYNQIRSSFTWASRDTTTATVRPDSADSQIAWARGVRGGTAVIEASTGSKKNVAGFEVLLPIARLDLVPDSANIPVGSSQGILVRYTDSMGGARSSPVIPEIFTSDTSIAVVQDIAGVVVTAKRSGRTQVITQALALGLADTSPVVVIGGGSVRVIWDNYNDYYPTSTFIAYEAAGQGVFVRDSAGLALTTGVDIKLTVSDTSILDVSPSTLSAVTSYATVSIHPKRIGSARITATVDSTFDVLDVRVIDIPVGRIGLTPQPPVITEGDTLRLGVNVVGVDDIGRAYPVQWTSSDSVVSTVSDSGVLVAKRYGRVRITAASSGKTASLDFIVASRSPPVVGAVSPSPLRPGAAFTISGAGFDPNPVNDTVTVDGVLVTVIAAADSLLTAQLPSAGAFPCSATHPARVTITTHASMAVLDHPMAIANERVLAVGQRLTLLAGPGAQCNELTQTGGTFVVEVLNSGTSAGDRVPFELHGSAATALQVVAPTPTLGLTLNPLVSDRVAVAARLKVFDGGVPHRQALEASRRFVERAGQPVGLWQARQAVPHPMQSVVDTLNGSTRLRIPDIGALDFCSRYISVTARRVYEGAHTVIFEDVAAPLAHTMDGYFNNLGLEFETVMYPLLLSYFGNPTALDTYLDGNGKIAMLFSPTVNSFGVGGFVTSCDFYPEAIAPSSNEGEIFYARVPTDPGVSFSADTRPFWYWAIRTVVMHEAKHLAAFAERLSRGAPLEEGWLEEGSAVLAEEIWSRGYSGATWKGGSTYDQTLYCEVRPTVNSCGARPFSSFGTFELLYRYGFFQNRSRTPLGPTDPYDISFYGSSWAFLRWTVDRYAGVEGDFLKALVQEPALSGTANLAARAGRPFAELGSDWSFALARGLTTEFPSWDLRNIFVGMYLDFPSDFSSEYPFNPQQITYGEFLQSVPGLPGGSAATFSTTVAPGAKQLLELRAPGGGPPSPVLRVTIVRIQ